MLRLVLPKGSLERATLQLFEDADLAVVARLRRRLPRHASTTRASTRCASCARRRSRAYVAEGRFDVGITGRDWIEERNAEVVTLTELHYSKATARPIRVVLAVAADSPAQTVADLPAGPASCTPSTPSSRARYFEKHGIDADVQLSYGATEAKVPDIADAVVEITETGRALRAAGLRIIDTILVSYTELIANPAAYADPEKRKAMEQLQTPAHRRARGARAGAAEAQRRRSRTSTRVIALLPALKSPTVSKLFGEDGFAVETVVAKSEINTLIPGAEGRRARPASSSCRSPRSCTDISRSLADARSRRTSAPRFR